MRQVAMICVLLVAAQLMACGSPPNEGATEADHPPRPRQLNDNLLSADGELFLLSTYFGVCMRNASVLRSTYDNRMPSSHFPTYAEITGGGGVLKIAVGKFDMYPGTVLKDIPETSPNRRIRIGRDRVHAFVLVSDFGAGDNLVSINYDEKDAYARPEAIRIANNVVGCHVSVAPASVDGS